MCRDIPCRIHIQLTLLYSSARARSFLILADASPEAWRGSSVHHQSSWLETGLAQRPGGDTNVDPIAPSDEGPNSAEGPT